MCIRDRLSTRLDYQPLFRKMIPHSSPGDECGRIKDRTQETAEIEPSFLQDRTTVKHFVETAGRVSVISPLFSQQNDRKAVSFKTFFNADCRLIEHE